MIQPDARDETVGAAARPRPRYVWTTVETRVRIGQRHNLTGARPQGRRVEDCAGRAPSKYRALVGASIPDCP